MVALETPLCDFGWKAKDFNLLGSDGLNYSFKDIAGENGTLIMFICNHCPYVKSIIDRLVADLNLLEIYGIGIAAIMSNDTETYPEDSYENMKVFAQNHHFTFPYLYDESQEVARTYNAVCTPDFFGFNSRGELNYRGRFDASRREAIPNARHDLYEAMKQIAETGEGPKEQYASIGCSLKWKKAHCD